MVESELFTLKHKDISVRDDIPAAFRRAWEHVAAPGSGWSGKERVAIAQETRDAWSCALCEERKAALSPNAVKETHVGSDLLSAAAVEATHRITTDPGRLTESWFKGLVPEGLSDSQYVEIIGIVGTITSIDTFHRALGLPTEALLQAVGPEGLADAAGIVGNFERMNRIADAGGLEVDAPIRILSANLRGELGLDKLASAQRAKPAGMLSKLVAGIAIPIAARVYSKRK